MTCEIYGLRFQTADYGVPNPQYNNTEAYSIEFYTLWDTGRGYFHIKNSYYTIQSRDVYQLMIVDKVAKLRCCCKKRIGQITLTGKRTRESV